MIDTLLLIALFGVIILAIITGLSRGLMVVAGSFLSLLVGLAAAGLGYKQLGASLTEQFGVVAPLANVLSYVMLLVIVQFVCLLILQRLIKFLPHQTTFSPANRIGGAVGAALEAVLLSAVALSIIASLPIDATEKAKYIDGPVARQLIGVGNKLQSIVGPVPEEDLTNTLNLLTVDPESEKKIELGFKTTDVTVNEQAEKRILELVNKERTSRGLKALKTNQKAQEVARAHSRDMFAQGYFSHISLDGRTPFDRMEEGGVEFKAAGENLALAPTVDLAHTGLMNSPGHRANILSPNYGTAGIGVIESPKYGLMVTQNFTN